MEQIEYWFDKKKLNDNPDPTPVKDKFKEMMYNGTILTTKGEAVFNAIWGNVGLKAMFDLSDTALKTPIEQFKDIISDTSNSNAFYNFIKVK